MITDPDSLLTHSEIARVLTFVYGLFEAINTALDCAGRNTEKYQATNRLIMIACALLGSFLSFDQLWSAITFILLLVIFGQFFAHKIGLGHDEGLADKMLWLTKGLGTLLSPLTMLLLAVAKLFLKLCRQKPGVKDETFSEEEVMSMLEAGQESGVIKEEGRKMIHSVFEFDDKLAYEIMTPRTDVFMIDLDDPHEEYFEDLMTLRHSRIPVCREEADNIVGVLHIKDFLRKAHECGSYEAVDIAAILRRPYLVPDTKNIDSLLIDMQKSRNQIAILIDEYGGFSGIVTVEDIVEQLVGDIDDEYDEESEIIAKVDDNTYLVDGDVDLDDLNDELGTELESEDSSTIGGFITDILGEIPDQEHVGQTVEFENYVFQITEVGERRIEKVRMTILARPSEEDDTAGSEET